MKRVIVEQQDVRIVDDVSKYRIYVSDFGCGDIALAQQIDTEPDIYRSEGDIAPDFNKWVFISIKTAANQRIVSNKYDSLKGLIQSVIECGNKVYELSNVKELAQYILSNTEGE